MEDHAEAYARWTDRLYDTAEREYGYDGQDGEAFASWRRRLREELVRTLGLDRIESGGDPDLSPRRVSTTEADGYERQKWIVRTEAGFDVPFYLLLPADGEAPHPVAVAVHGHCDGGKELAAGTVETDVGRSRIEHERRDIAVQAVRRGYATIAPDVRGFGELSLPDPDDDGRSCRRMQLHAQLFDRTLVGDRVWDVRRLVDFAERRPELDDDRVAITGHSGGGAVALFAAAVDERFSVAAPNAFFCTFEDSIVDLEHCVCNYVPGILRVAEMWDVAGLIAPRPLVVAAGRDDPIFPIEGTRRAYDRLREIYRAAGAADACELYVGDGGHEYYEEGIWPFVDAHL